MAKNMFINTTGLEIEKSMPSLIGMDFNDVVKKNTPDIDIGKTISNFATKYKKIEQSNNALAMQNKLSEMENEWRLKNMTDPNANTTAEGRKSIRDGYNALIEEKKKLLVDAKSQFDSESYMKLENYFKTQTYGSLIDLQKDANVGYIKEQTDNVLLNNALAVEQIALAPTEELRNMLSAEAISNMKQLNNVGVDTRNMEMEFIGTAQQKVLELEVERNIMNNNTNPKFFMQDENGEYVYDSQGNHIIDNAKKMKALDDLYDSFLSDAVIRQAGDAVSKVTNITSDDAFNIIKNIRQTKIKAHRQYNESLLSNRAQMSKYDVMAYQNKVEIAGNKNVQSMNTAFSNGDLYKGLSISTGVGVDAKNITSKENTFLLTNGKTDNYSDLLKRGQYIPLLTPNDVNFLKNTKIEDMSSYNSFKNYFSDIIKDLSPDAIDSCVSQLQRETGIPASALNAMVATKCNSVPNLGISDEDIFKTISAQTRIPDPSVDLKVINKSMFDTPDTPFTGNIDRDKFIYKDMMQNYDKYVDANNIPINVFKGGDVNRDLLLKHILTQYNNPRGKVKIDEAIKQTNLLSIKSNNIPFIVDFGEGSLLNKSAFGIGAYEKGIQSAPSLYKKDAKATDIAVQELSKGVTTTSGLDLPNGQKEYYKNELLEGRINLKEIEKIDPNKMNKEQYKDFYDMFVDVALMKLQNNDIDINDIPQSLITDPRMNEYFNELIKQEGLDAE